MCSKHYHSIAFQPSFVSRAGNVAGLKIKPDFEFTRGIGYLLLFHF